MRFRKTLLAVPLAPYRLVAAGLALFRPNPAMKISIILATCTLLVGCSKPATPDPRIDQLQADVRSLKIECSTQANQISNLFVIIGQIHSDILNPATGLPYGATPAEYSGAIDPKTGLPLHDRPPRAQ